MSNVPGLAEHFADQCNRERNGQCSTRRCLKRGGWRPEDPVDYSRATCEEREAMLAIQERDTLRAERDAAIAQRDALLGHPDAVHVGALAAIEAVKQCRQIQAQRDRLAEALPRIRERIAQVLGTGLASNSIVFAQDQWSKGYCAGVTAALTGFDDARAALDAQPQAAPAVCPECGGQRVTPGHNPDQCPACKGTGYVAPEPRCTGQEVAK